MDTKALTGLHPARVYGSGANSTGIKKLPIASGDARDMFTGDLVKVSLYYEADGVPTWKKYWPANTSASNIEAMVMVDPDMTYYIGADASCTAGDIYLNFDLTLGSGNTATGISGFGLKAATRVATTAQVKAVGVKDIPGNDIDVATERAFPIMAVKILRSEMDQFAVNASVVAPI